MFAARHARSALVCMLAVVLLLSTSAGAVGASASRAQENPCENFDRNNFSNPTKIDNKWLPLYPGMQHVHEGFTEEPTGERIPHRLETTVTDLTKVIDGVRTVVVWVVDHSAGQLVEKEIAFYAQDNDGSVWYLGEHPEEYEDGEFVAAPTWIHGFADARAGIKMKAAPQLGTPSYCVGWGPAIDFNDRRQVSQMGQENCVPFSCYKDVLVIDEFSLAEPNAIQTKYFAPGVGNVRVGWKGDDAAKETLELVSAAQLDAAAMAEVRTLALELEKHAYEISKDVYAHTSPAEGPAVAGPAESGPAAAPPAAGSEAPAPSGDTPPPAALPRTGAQPAEWRIDLLLACGLGMGAAGWFVRRRAARR